MGQRNVYAVNATMPVLLAIKTQDSKIPMLSKYCKCCCNLETLKLNFRLDSNPGPCASKPDLLSTIPNFLRKIF